MNLVRKPFIVAALILFATAFAIEAGSRLWVEAKVNGVTPENAPRPGLGIPSLAALDVLVLLSLVVLTLVVIGVPARIVGRIQGIAAVIISFFGLLSSLVMLMVTIGALMLMVGLLVAVPFGTAVYVALVGDFSRSPAALTLGAVIVAIFQWGTGAGTRGARLRYASSVVIVLFFVWSLSQWNLLGWRM